jgi:uncharacterized membrane protein
MGNSYWILIFPDSEFGLLGGKILQMGEMLVFLAALDAVVSAIFWAVVGWHAMRAHERLAQAMEHLARRS